MYCTHNNNEIPIRFLFYFLWIAVNLIQAYFTELSPDEAYYWMYSNHLAWGYFDHPPVIAFLIKIGYSLFNNQLGVRLLPVLISATTIFIWERIIKPKNLFLFYTLCVSIGILHFFTGFIAIPDSPFILTASCFFLLYKRFIERVKWNWRFSILLGILIPIMLLSKYHGIIIIGLTIVSNLKLFRNLHFWLITIISITLFIPHLLWQIDTSFISLNYHFMDRSAGGYSISNTLEYIITQPFILGPFTGIFLLIACIKKETNNPYERTLKFVFWGGYLIFFLLTFRGRVEGHWTLFVVFPAVYFGYRLLSEAYKIRQVFYYFSLISVILILAARIIIMSDVEKFMSIDISKVTKLFHNKEKMIAINKQAGDFPVAFMNSYQSASLYEFYSGSKGFSLNNVMGRKNQFDIWNTEDVYRGKKIMLIPNYDVKEFDTIFYSKEKIRYTFIENFQSFSNIRIFITKLPVAAYVSDTLCLKINMENTTMGIIDIDANRNYPSYICCQFFKGNKLVIENNLLRISNNILNNELEIKIVTPDSEGNYGLYLTIKTGWLPPTINSKRYKIKVLKKF